MHIFRHLAQKSLDIRKYACGDNCAKWIYEISKHKDLTIDLHHVMNFSDCEGFSAYIVNTDKQVGSYKEYLDEALRIEER